MKRKGSLSVVCALLCMVIAFALFGCGSDTLNSEPSPPPETVRLKYLPISSEESFSGYHWIRYAVYHENEKFGILSNTQTANVTQQTFKQDPDGSFIVEYSCPEIYEPNMGFPERTIYKTANIFYDGYYNAEFGGCVYDDDDASFMARAYVNWQVEFIGTDWELYQPILHVYRIFYTYIERNSDETITFYRCNFTHRLYYNEDWLAEYAINPDKIPTYAPSVTEKTRLKFVLDSTGEVVITDENLLNIEVVYDNNSGGYVVALELNEYGTRRFSEITSNHVGDTISVVVIDESRTENIVSSPTINSAITNGKVIITLSGSYDDALALYNQIAGSA